MALYFIYQDADSNLDQKWIKAFTRKLDLRRSVNRAYGWAQKFEATANYNNNNIIRYSSEVLQILWYNYYYYSKELTFSWLNLIVNYDLKCNFRKNDTCMHKNTKKLSSLHTIKLQTFSYKIV